MVEHSEWYKEMSPWSPSKVLKPFNDGMVTTPQTCPHCQATTRQIKIGFNKSGSQKFKCQHCKKRYTPREPGE